MAIQLGSAYGKVSIDVNGLVQGVASAKGSLQSLASVGMQVGNTMKNIGQTMTIGMTLPLLAMGAASIKAASDFEETKNKSIVVFGEMSDSVVKNADKAADALGMSKQQYLDYASSIGAALTAGGMGIKEATEMSEQAVKHFADLASFHNTQVADAAVAWQSAIRGQFEPIQKYFPFITNQYLITYGTANGLIDANTKQLDANQRAIILNAIALEEDLNPALNDFAETSDGLANSSRSLQANLKNAAIELGENLLPIALKVVQGLNDLVKWLTNLPEPIQDAIIMLAGLAITLGPVFTVIGNIIGAISGVIGFFGSLGISAGTVGTVLTTIVIPAIGTFIGILGSVILPLVLIIGTVYAVYWAFKNNFGGISTTVTQMWFLIKYYFGQIVNFLKSINLYTIGFNLILGMVKGMIAALPKLIEAAKNAATSAVNAIKNTLGIHSESTVFKQLGAFSGQGYQSGLMGAMDPNQVARTMARPVQNMTSQQSTRNTFHLSSGITIEEADRLIDRKLSGMVSQISYAMGGA